MFADATILVVVTPHQFIGKQLPLLKSVIAPSCHAISLIKVRGGLQPTRALETRFSFAHHASQGIEFEGHNIRLISSIIR
jgi:glycerol-3-phosphate dehydrogenase